MYLRINLSYLIVVYHSAKYNSEENLQEDKKTFSSRVNETEKLFKDSLGYPSNPLNPSNPPNPLNPSNLLNPSNPLGSPESVESAKSTDSVESGEFVASTETSF